MAAEKPTKFQNYHPKSNGISFWAFLFSILVYISIFYIFNLSPSSLVNTTKFWFFISNTLILIIAVDFGAFSSSSRKQSDQIYEDYVTKTQEKSQHLPSFESQYRQIVKTRGNNSPQKLENHQEKIKEVVIAHHHHSTSESTPNNMQIVVKEELHDQKVVDFSLSSKSFNETHHHKEKKGAEEKQVDLRRTQSEKYESTKNVEVVVEEEEDENEFLGMSNEELNRRVEEFIRRFNRQIRLQAVQERAGEI